MEVGTSSVVKAKIGHFGESKSILAEASRAEEKFDSFFTPESLHLKAPFIQSSKDAISMMLHVKKVTL